MGVIKENGNKELVLHTNKKNLSEIMDWRNINCKGPSKYDVYLKCDKGIFKISYSELAATNDNSVSYIVNSVDDGKTSFCKLEEIKKMLGLNSERTVAIIDQIPQKPEVASPASKVPVSDSKVLSSEAGKPGELLDNLSREQFTKSKLIISPF